MFSDNRGLIFTMIIIVLISVAALVAVIYSLAQALDILQFGQVEALEPDREVDIQVLDTQYNYNFAIPEVQEQETYPTNPETKKKQKEQEEEVVEQTDTTQEEPAKEKATYNYHFSIPEKKVLPKMLSIQIPNIGYNSPIIVSDNADTGVDFGAWYYPGSYHPQEGESIFLCHRRYFEENDPKSCWNLNKLSNGDSLYLNFTNGEQIHYKIQSIAVTQGDDLNIYNTSQEDLIKLISCAKEDGKIGSDSHRIVLVASKVG